jgi:hypothetical protein
LEQEEAGRPGRNAGENVLLQIERYKRRILKNDKWSGQEKEELLRFLSMQASSWGMLGDGLGSEGVKRAKERMLLHTWRKFTAGIKEGKKKGVVVETVGGIVEAGLEEEPSTSGSIIQADVMTLTDGIETPVGTDSPVGQTVFHDEPITPKEGDKN